MPKASAPPPASSSSATASTPPPTNTTAGETGRIRSSRACLHCSRRKVKCDGLQPCNNCSKDNTLCEYGAQKKRGPPKGCEPKGGRKKKLLDVPPDVKPSTSSTPSVGPPAKRKAQPSTHTEAPAPPLPSSKLARTSPIHARSPLSRSPSRLPSFNSSLPPPNTHAYFNGSTDAAVASPSLSSSSSKWDPLSHSRSLAEPVASRSQSYVRSPLPTHERSATHSQPPPSSSYNPSSSTADHSPWPRGAYSHPSTSSSPSLSRRNTYLNGNNAVDTAYPASSYPSTAHPSRTTASAPTSQHYSQAYSSQHAHSHHQADYHHSDAWPASSSSPADARFSHDQPATSTYQYDSYPLQAPLRDYHRPSPLSSHRSMPPPPPHTMTSQPHSSYDTASHQDRSANSPFPARSNPTPSASTFASPRAQTTRTLYESPNPHYTSSGPSPLDRTSAMPPSTTALASRHPVSASRSTEPASSVSQHIASTASTSSHVSVPTTSPAFTGPSHGYSPSSTAMPHRPWYNGSQPSSPRGAASIPRSQISSPGAHWLDYHIRPGSAAANHPPSTSRTHLEDRLPPHILQRLLDIYQVFVHPHWPIIYLPSFTSLHSLKRSRPIVFEAILAVASNTFDPFLDTAAGDEQQSVNPLFDGLYAESPLGLDLAWKSNELRDHFVNRVKARIFEGKFVQDIGTIQAAILISVIELGCGNTSSAFQFGGIACRMALDMNLHRYSSQASASAAPSIHGDGGATDNADGERSEARRSGSQLQERLRVFWACFILDKILSTALDKPAQLRTAEIECDWPSVQEADEYDLWINETTRKFVDKGQLTRLEGVKVHALSSFKAWAEVMAILERILEEVYSPQAKRDRRRTKGASDYEALLRLNDRLSKWRADLPSHLKWSGTWTSPDVLFSAQSQSAYADRKESDPHRGLPPQILTMRAWYCTCLILLHRPRVPKLVEGPKEHASGTSEDADAAAQTDANSPAAKKGKKGSQTSAKDKRSPAGLDICNAAAKEVCDILHVYGSSFRIRKISSSWVYLIFQSATIHAALAASKSVVAFKARQSSIWSRRGSKVAFGELGAPLADDHHELSARTDDAEAHANGAEAFSSEARHVPEAELEGASELVKTSALYLAECVRYLKRIGPTWQSASNHVSVLRNLCIASAQARPLSPTLKHGRGVAQPDPQASNELVGTVKQEPAAFDSDQRGAPANDVGASMHGHTHQVDGPPAGDHGEHVPITGHEAGVNSQASYAAPISQHVYHEDRKAETMHMPSAATAAAGTTSELAVANTDGMQPHFLASQGYAPPAHPPAQLLPPAAVGVHSHLPPPHHAHHAHQQAGYPINANDAAFWASMPVASEGYNEWDEFFRAFNPGGAAADVTANPNYHPTAAVDLITALQDPNRLLNGLQ
ncbi:hypothetical protein L1887_50262 [Cichorium endivia]|nr:hypothetical protein L1887_50262 [Cichorium endivia]